MQFSSKYREIRKIFFQDFYYQGSVADRINDGSKEIKFGDQTVYMGQALIFLATELPILEASGSDTSDTIAKITEILDMIDTLDDQAEEFYGFPSNRNGFIVRDNFRTVADSRLAGRWTSLIADGKDPNNNSPSGDQLFGLLYGLWFVKRFAPTAEISNRCIELVDRIYCYAMRCKFFLKLPNGDPTRRGADCQWLSSLLHGLAKSITEKDRFNESKIDIMDILHGAPGGVSIIPRSNELDTLIKILVSTGLLKSTETGLQGIASFWDDAGGNASEVLGSEIEIPILKRIERLKDFKLKVKSFSSNIILMAIAPTEIWSSDEFENAAISVNHHFAALWYALAHGTTPKKFTKADIYRILEGCPDSGPRSGLPPNTGWQTDNRWIRCSDIDKPTDPGYRYFGVDFLMFHNICEIVFR